MSRARYKPKYLGKNSFVSKLTCPISEDMFLALESGWVTADGLDRISPEMFVLLVDGYLFKLDSNLEYNKHIENKQKVNKNGKYIK